MISHNQLKNDLKKIGCKLKSQLGGGWAIQDPKGKRVIFKTLEDVQHYYLSKNTGTVNPNVVVNPLGQEAQRQAQEVSPVAMVHEAPVRQFPVRPETATNPGSNATVRVSVPSATKATLVHKTNAIEPQGFKVAAELNDAIAKADQLIKLLRERRLKMGINVSHSDLRINLIPKVCPAGYMDDVMHHVVFSLEDDCRKKVLVKRHFKNHLNEDDVMYFDINYENLLA